MRLDVLCVCRRPPPWIRDATQDYSQRLPRDLTLEFAYVAPGLNSVSAAERRRDEGLRLLKRLKPDVRLVALDERGTEVDSDTVAQWLKAWRAGGKPVALAIGGADGLDSAILGRAERQWSLSRLTLPHLVVQIIVAEQLYRAWTIDGGHPYHRG
jgi:23S rRNA (pseudouridine1915-N3)-methyltransferase